MKKIVVLYKFLKSSGYEFESLILKKAYPIIEEGFMELGDGGSVERRLPSSSYDEVGGHSASDWYDAVGYVSDDIVVLTYGKDMDSSFYEKIYNLFSEGSSGLTSYSYKDLDGLIFSRARVTNDELLSLFPSVRDSISSSLLSSNPDMSESDISSKISDDLIIILLGSHSSGTLYKSPYYLGHDLGHQLMDADYDESDFRHELEMAIEEVAKLYKLYESEEELSEEESEEFSEEESEESVPNDIISNIREDLFVHGISEPSEFLIKDFFPTTNKNVSDRYPDVFGNFVSGNFNFEIPDSLEDNSGNYYELFPEDKEKAEAILQEFVDKNALAFGGEKNLESEAKERLTDYIESIGEDISSPISYLKGKSILL